MGKAHADCPAVRSSLGRSTEVHHMPGLPLAVALCFLRSLESCEVLNLQHLDLEPPGQPSFEDCISVISQPVNSSPFLALRLRRGA